MVWELQIPVLFIPGERSWDLWQCRPLVVSEKPCYTGLVLLAGFLTVRAPLQNNISGAKWAKPWSRESWKPGRCTNGPSIPSEWCLLMTAGTRGPCPRGGLFNPDRCMHHHPLTTSALADSAALPGLLSAQSCSLLLMYCSRVHSPAKRHLSWCAGEAVPQHCWSQGQGLHF